MLLSALLSLALATGHYVAATPTPQGTTPAADKGLHVLAKARGKYFGTAVNGNVQNDKPYRDQLSNPDEFGVLVAENAMKWNSLQKEKDVFTWGGADYVADLAAKNGQKLRCHALIFNQSTPAWVRDGNFKKQELIDIMKKHIKTVVTRYKGKCTEWDVVNEALAGQDYKKNVFFNTIGEDYIPIAFKAAEEADPNAKLCYNDNQTDRPEQPRVEGVKKIIKLIRAKGGRIDIVGRQAHLGAPGPSKEDQMKTMKMWTDLDVDVVLTEVDVGLRIKTDEGVPIVLSKETVDKQVEAYRKTTAACADTPRCKGITLWGHTDRYSWLTGYKATLGSGTPWDKDLKKKPAYYGIVEGFKQN